MLAASSLLAGIVLVGATSLVNLSGVLTSPGRMFVLTVVSWLYCLLPVLAYTSLAILFSIATRNGILGVLGPLLVALVDPAARPDRQGGDRPHAPDRLRIRRLARPARRPPVLRPGARLGCRLRGVDRRLPRDQLADPPPSRLPIDHCHADPQLDRADPRRGDRHRRRRRPRPLRQPRPDRRDRHPAERGHRPDVQQRHAAPAGADRPPCPARRAARRPAQLRTQGRRGGRPGRLELHPLRLPPAAERGSLPADRRRVRRERPVQRLLQGAVAAELHRRPDDAGRRRKERHEPAVTSSTGASTPCRRVRATADQVGRLLAGGRAPEPRAWPARIGELVVELDALHGLSADSPTSMRPLVLRGNA